MYFIGILIFLGFLCISTLLSASLAVFMDLPSLLIILVFCIPMLLASGLMPDFLRGFKLMSQKENRYSAIELRKTDLAVSLMTKLLLISGLLGSLIGVISMLSSLSDLSLLGPNLAVSLLTPFYSILFIFILLPIRARVRAILGTLD